MQINESIGQLQANVLGCSHLSCGNLVTVSGSNVVYSLAFKVFFVVSLLVSELMVLGYLIVS